MRLGLYGGSFDPIHHGHLILAREAIEQLALDRVIFIPAALSPHKLHTTPAPAELRLEMVKASVAGEPQLSVDGSEIHRAGPSFTIDTVEQMQRQHPGAELFYFVGADNLPALGTWRRIEELRALVQFVVFGRGTATAAHPFPTIERRIDISATDVRARVACGRSIRYLVPEAARLLIASYQLYQEPTHQL